MNGHGAGSDGTDDIEREAERLGGDVLEGRVPSADAPTPPPAQAAPPTGQAAAAAAAPAPPATSPPAPPVDLVAEGLEGISEYLMGLTAVTPPPAPAASSSPGPQVLDSVLTITEPTDDLATWTSEVTRDASVALAEPLGQGHSSWERHSRIVALTGAAIVALAAFIAALLVLQGSGGAPGTPADPAAVAQASAASPVEPSDVVPSDDPTPEPTPSPTPTATPLPTPGNVTIRGPIDASEFSGTATSMRVGTHEALLAFDPKGGPVSGTFTIELKEFPIGLLLTSTFKGEKDPGFAEFKDCTVTLALVGQVKGTYDVDTGKLSGKAAFKSVTDDVDDCLKTRPSNLSIDSDDVTKPTTVKWRAKFNGTRATGSLGLKPAMDFSATIED